MRGRVHERPTRHHGGHNVDSDVEGYVRRSGRSPKSSRSLSPLVGRYAVFGLLRPEGRYVQTVPGLFCAS